LKIFILIVGYIESKFGIDDQSSSFYVCALAHLEIQLFLALEVLAIGEDSFFLPELSELRTARF